MGQFQTGHAYECTVGGCVLFFCHFLKLSCNHPVKGQDDLVMKMVNVKKREDIINEDVELIKFKYYRV